MISWLKLITYSESIILPIKTQKVVFLVWFPQLAKSKKSLITVKVRTLKRTFSKLVLQLSATNVKVMCILLPTVQAHLRLPSMTEFSLKYLSMIVLFLQKSLMWTKSLLSHVLSLSRLYCQHHLLRFFYYRSLLSLYVLITNTFLYCRHYPLFSYDLY